MNENRNVFGLDGAGGFLVAVLLLLGALAFLTWQATVVQGANASNFYEIQDEKSIKMISVDNAKHIVDVK
ncbi:MAG: DUF4006 family protein [Sulfurimonas sp.]